MSCCTKCGVPKPRVLTLVLLSVAIIVQVVSLALPEWSAIDTMYYQYPVKAYQNLWRENFIEDGGGNAFPKEESKIQNDWKKTVQKVEITCLVAGLVGMFLLLLSSVTNKLVTLSGVCRLLGICFSALAGIEVLVGSLLYKYQHKEIFSILAKDPKNEYPTEKLELSYGFYTSVASGALYGFVVVFELVVLIKNHVKYEKEANAVRSLN